MSFIQDFKAFALKGNVVDMAVGVIIGGAFGKIVTSIVNNIIMPPIGVITGGVDFTDLKLVIKEAEKAGSEDEAAGEQVEQRVCESGRVYEPEHKAYQSHGSEDGERGPRLDYPAHEKVAETEQQRKGTELSG